jgi:hypothetical protein
MKKLIPIIAIIISIAILLTISLSNNRPIKAESDPQKDLDNERVLLGDGRVDESIQLLQKVIRENPGSNYEADARFELAGIYGWMKHDGDKMINEYETIIRNFPNTAYEFSAKSYLVFVRYRKKSSFNTWIEQQNNLIVSYGGINVNDILKYSGKYRQDWADKIKSIPVQYRNDVIPDAYNDITDLLEGPELKRKDDALKILMFLRTYFPRSEAVRESIKDIQVSIQDNIDINIRVNFPDDTTPPQIRAITPHSGLSIGEDRPKIEIELTDGDISQAQVDLTKTFFTLDGQDLTDIMEVDSNINKCARLGPDFETIRLKYRPEKPLSPGCHTVYVKAVDFQKKVSEKTWTFTVKKQHSCNSEDKKPDKKD